MLIITDETEQPEVVGGSSELSQSVVNSILKNDKKDILLKKKWRKTLRSDCASFRPKFYTFI